MILSAAAIGAGEWILAPATIARYGAGLTWVIFLALVVQTFMYIESLRYTLYTGEPIHVGYMRLFPGRKFWAILIVMLCFIEFAWPGWALASATGLAALYLGRLPGQEDRAFVITIGYLVLMSAVVLVSVGRKVEDTLEKLSWFFTIALLSTVIWVIFYIPDWVWPELLVGSFSFGYFPPGVDWSLVAAAAGWAGAGGAANMALTSWARDKGWGMGKEVGYIPAAIGGRKIGLSAKGKVFRVTPASLRRWRQWFRIANFDQWLIFFAITTFVTYVILAMAYGILRPRGLAPTGFAVAAVQGEAFREMLGYVGWVLILLIGFWMLFDTQFEILDIISRVSTDSLWAAGLAKKIGDARIVYYGIVMTMAGLGSVLIHLAPPLTLLTLGAVSGILLLLIAYTFTPIVNRKLLPKELRAPAWREAIMVLGSGFFMILLVATVLSAMGMRV